MPDLAFAPDLALVAAIEQHSALAWPAPDVVALNGWELRYTPGSRSRRVNCLTPVQPAPGRFAETLERARALCRERGITCTVRLMPLAGDEPFVHLRAMGLEGVGPTSVQVADLRERPASEGVRLVQGFDAAWVEQMGLAHDDSDQERAIITKLLAEVTEPQTLAVAFDGRTPAAFGRTVIRDRLAGIFHIVTDPSFRRRGHARRLVLALMAAAQAQGATRAFLQVEMRNETARALYASLGFQHVYTYDHWAVKAEE